MDEAHDERWAEIRRSRRESDPAGDHVDAAVARMRERLASEDVGSVRHIEEIRLLAIEAVKPTAGAELADDVAIVRSSLPDPRMPRNDGGQPDEPHGERSSERTTRSRIVDTTGVIAIVAGLAAPALLGQSIRSAGTFFDADTAVPATGLLMAVSALLFQRLARGRTKTRYFNDQSPPTAMWVIVLIWWTFGAAGSVWRALDEGVFAEPRVLGGLALQVGALVVAAALLYRTRRISRASGGRQARRSSTAADFSATDAAGRRLASRRRQIRDSFSEAEREAALAAEVEGIRWWNAGGTLDDDGARASLASAFDRWSPDRT